MRFSRRGLTAAVLILMLTVIGSGADKPSGQVAFDLEEVSGFGIGYGRRCTCENTPEPNVVYPEFSSERPLYGLVCVDGEFGDQLSGTLYHFAIDESTPSSGYDRLYLDYDKDGGLGDEKAVDPFDNMPDGALLAGDWIARQVCFNYVTFSSTDDNGVVHTAEYLPRLTVSHERYAVLEFVATKAYKGQIEIAGRQFSAVIKHNYVPGTRLDRPGTMLELRAIDDSAWRPIWGPCSDALMAIHKIGGKYWCFSAAPSGDRLFVKPYSGDYGILKVGSGGRMIWTTKLGGSLYARDKTVAIGYDTDNKSYEPVSSIRLPVGDYAPAMLDVHFGPLRIDISDNYHSDGKPRQRDKPMIRGIKIRKDKPFALDFSNKPEVIFASPARDTRLKPGEELSVMAVLVDPKLDIMIRDIRVRPFDDGLSPRVVGMFAAAVAIPLLFWLLSGKVRKRYRYLPALSAVAMLAWIGSAITLDKLNDNMNRGRQQYDSLTPRVAICRADGEVVAEGTMPFG